MAFFPVKHWDLSAPDWDKTVENRNNPHYFYYYEADLYIDDILKKTGVALELGTGTCGSTIRHAPNGMRIVGVDYSAAMARVGQQKLREAQLYDLVDLVVADECHLPFKGDSFDAVFSRGVALSYASDPEKLTREAFRVLNQGCPIGIDFMNELVAGKSDRRFCRLERIDDTLYYVEQLNEGGRQKRIGYKLPSGFRPPQPVEEGSVFGGFELKPDWVNLEGLEKEEWWASFYTPSRARKLFRSAGFKTIKLFPLGCFSYRLKDRKLNEFLRDNRDRVCKLQKELSKVFKVEAGVHIFLAAVKPKQRHLTNVGKHEMRLPSAIDSVS